MLKRLIEKSLLHPGIVVVLGLLLGVYGAFVAHQSRLDVFPEFAPPRVVIQTEAPGFSAEEVEALVTRPVEYGLNGTPELDALYSQSIQGLSVITAVFHDDANILRVRQLTGERLSELAARLPQGVRQPQMGALASSTSLTLVLGLTAGKKAPMELRTFADSVVRQRLLSVPGIARVELFGGEVRQLQIRFRPERLMAYRLSIDELLAAARNATGIRGSGFIENANQRVTLSTRGQSFTPAELEKVVVGYRNGFAVRFEDVASVVNGPEPPLGGGLVNSQPGVVVMVHSQYGANTLDVTRRVETALKDMKSVMASEGVELHSGLFRPANFIEESIHNIGMSLLIGGLLVVLVLYAFLRNVRSALIAFVTIPLSLLAAVIVLDAAGASLNTITLGGFAISIGVVVDDAVIGLENVWRRLREAKARGSRQSTWQTVVEATLEVRSPIVYATFIVAAVFIPVVMMTGINGRLFAPLGAAFLLATFASLIVAVTLTPTLCYLFLPGLEESEPKYIGWLKRVHAVALAVVIRRSSLVIALTAGVCVAAAAALPFLGGEFLPDFKEGHYIVRATMAPGTSTMASLAMGEAVSKLLLRDPAIQSVSQEVGRAEQGEDSSGPEFSEFHVELRRGLREDQGTVKARIREALESVPGIATSVTPFLAERIDEVVSGSRGAIVVKIVGSNLDALDRAVDDVRRVMSTVRGAADVYAQRQIGAPEAIISLRKDRLSQFGFSPVGVLDAVQTAYQGTVVAQVYQDNQVIDVNVLLEPARRQEPEAIGSLLIENAFGTRLPLRELASIRMGAGRYIVEHEATVRSRQVSCNVEGRDVASFAAELKQKLGVQVRLPQGVILKFAGAAEAQSKALRELLLYSGLAAVIIVLLLAVIFLHARNLFLVLANLPFALAGGVMAAVFSGGSLSLGSLVGFISLFGISARNSILLIAHYEQLVVHEGVDWGREAAIRGATERLVPILMTALVVALALLPIALQSGSAGKEIEGPMAVVILGGLATSTALNLLVLPALALRFGRFLPPRRHASEDRAGEISA